MSKPNYKTKNSAPVAPKNNKKASTPKAAKPQNKTKVQEISVNKETVSGSHSEAENDSEEEFNTYVSEELSEDESIYNGSEPSVVDEEEIEDLISLEELQNQSADEGDEEAVLDEDAVPVQKVTKYNKVGLQNALKRIQFKKLDWIETQAFTASEPLVINDIHNDIDRELAFYGQALAAAELAIKKFKSLNLPFSRPDDYFAEMVKSDEHMSKIRQKLLDTTQSIKASENARKQRELKKFGKQIQVEKIKERHLQKRQELEKITNLKRKLKNNNGKDKEEFKIDLDDEPAPKPNKRAKNDKPNTKRLTKDKTFGFGGKKRGAKRNTRDSANSMDDGYDPRKNKASFGAKSKGSKPNRPGKSRRKVSSRK